MFFRCTILFYLLLNVDLLLAESVVSGTKVISNPVTGSMVLQWFLGLLFVLLIIVGCGWLLRKYGNITGSTNTNLKILGGVSVGTREKVLLLQAGNKQLVIGVAPGQVRMLYVLEENDHVGESLSNKGKAISFSDQLDQVTKEIKS